VFDPKKKNVEDWMGELEDMMKESVRKCLLDSVVEYPTILRTEWVKNHSG
jgi:dynein heavy chain